MGRKAAHGDEFMGLLPSLPPVARGTGAAAMQRRPSARGGWAVRAVLHLSQPLHCLLGCRPLLGCHRQALHHEACGLLRALFGHAWQPQVPCAAGGQAAGWYRWVTPARLVAPLAQDAIVSATLRFCPQDSNWPGPQGSCRAPALAPTSPGPLSGDDFKHEDCSGAVEYGISAVRELQGLPTSTAGLGAVL